MDCKGRIYIGECNQMESEATIFIIRAILMYKKVEGIEDIELATLESLQLFNCGDI